MSKPVFYRALVPRALTHAVSGRVMTLSLSLSLSSARPCVRTTDGALSLEGSRHQQ